MSREMLQFLPAVLELQETPPLPVSRLLLWAILLFLSIAVIWASVGEVDVVGVAPGKIVPSGRSKAVQALETSVVRRILVADGDRVSEGQLLIELDPTETEADRERVQREMHSLQRDALRLAALTAALEAGEAPSLASAHFPADTTPAQIALQRRQLERQHAEFAAALRSFADGGTQKRAELAAVQRRLAGLGASLPLLEEQANAVRELMQRKLAPRLQWLELERQRIAASAEGDALAEEVRALEAEIATLAARREATAAQYEARWLAELDALHARIASYRLEGVKAERLRRLRELRAPVAGTVQQLAVHTVGGVVTPAQPLLVVVPENDTLQVQAWVPNKDIGFVSEGASAEVKIDTFPFTRYGTVEGEVTSLSDDAVSDEKAGLVYLANVSLAREFLSIDGRDVPLAPGMSVSVELHLGARRVIEFLLSPLLRYSQEAWRER